MGRSGRPDQGLALLRPGLVERARDGDEAALDELIGEYLPLVYNIVGRALDGHCDVDDVVQETMLQVVRKLHTLREPDSFRAWLVAIAMQQVRLRGRIRQEAMARRSGLEEAAELADPGADFADLTITRLELSGQRREAVEASRWLEAEDRQLLSLWWLETAGELTRAEVAAALELSTDHAAVRIQRVKAQLHAARVVVRALWGGRNCAQLLTLLDEWDSRPSALWRKRLVRHTRACIECGRHWSALVPSEKLLAGMALVPIPAAFAMQGPAAAGGTAAAAAASVKGALAAVQAGFAAVQAGFAAVTGKAAALWAAVAGKVAGSLAGRVAGSKLAVAAGKSKVATVALYGTAIVVAAAVVYIAQPESPRRSLPEAAPGAIAPEPAGATPPGTAEPDEPLGRRDSVSLMPARLSEPPSTPTSPGAPGSRPARPGYGSGVDGPEAPPPAGRYPGLPPRRPERGVGLTGGLRVPWSRTVLLLFRGTEVTMRGQGYVQVTWTVNPRREPGELTMPTWTGLRGKLFHAASGGGYRLDDQVPGARAGQTYLGPPGRAATLPRGAQMMWHNEFYYLDGEVTLHQNETVADYGLAVTPTGWRAVAADVTRGPDRWRGAVRYGYLRDRGGNSCPVPQYVTRGRPADPASVAQRSVV